MHLKICSAGRSVHRTIHSRKQSCTASKGAPAARLRGQVSQRHLVRFYQSSRGSLPPGMSGAGLTTLLARLSAGGAKPSFSADWIANAPEGPACSALWAACSRSWSGTHSPRYKRRIWASDTPSACITKRTIGSASISSRKNCDRSLPDNLSLAWALSRSASETVRLRASPGCDARGCNCIKTEAFQAWGVRWPGGAESSVSMPYSPAGSVSSNPGKVKGRENIATALLVS